MKKTTQANILLFMTALIWGIAFVAQRAGMDYVGAFTYGGARFLLGAASLIPVILIFERGATDRAKMRRSLLSGAVGGVILFSAVSLQQFGIVVTGSAGRAGFITALYIIFTPIFGMFFGRKCTVLTIIGAFFALVGMYLLSVTNGFGAIGFGDILLIIGAVFWTAHILFIDHFADNIYPVRFSMVQFLVCAALSLIGAFATETVTLQSIYDGRVSILYGGILSAGVAYTLQVLGQRNAEPSKAAIIFSLESLFSVIGAAILLGERMTPRGYAGCAFIFAGIIISQLVKKPKREIKADSYDRPA
ncbi:MAG: DMT family transporter [Oscillospiraceae bacterium]|jgi:drug/metabolite transporter (DMT)-like permease|nr:DMT family transporter [Oscillospiraceae bacterium]